MIANKIIPKDYNYSHVPLLQGNFINKTHAQKGDKIINIHEQEDEQRREDFKRQVFLKIIYNLIRDLVLGTKWNKG